ncbi:hypothetical protein [Cellvibrio mixtus]|uniref:hypothetical protein n=1 Tax=Cellvibrio mixtus TaxID=39650 RepID=UPI000587B28F|nr:hypothetical protein [Cellvibrio mixtus]
MPLQTDDLIEKLTKREINWISAYMNMRETESILDTDSFSLREKKLKVYALANDSNLKEIELLKHQSGDRLLFESELAWINKNDSRLLKWIAYYWAKAAKGAGRLSIKAGGTEIVYENFIFAIDWWPVNLENKRMFINQAKSEWAQILQNDRKLAWLDIKNQSQIEWAWAYIRESMKDYVNWKDYNPTSTEEMYLDILSIFDMWDGNPAELREHQSKLKQAWAQQKYRANLHKKKKKQSTYVLSTETKTQLETLARVNNVNLNQMLEYIINQAFKNSKRGQLHDISATDNNIPIQ